MHRCVGKINTLELQAIPSSSRFHIYFLLLVLIYVAAIAATTSIAVDDVDGDSNFSLHLSVC